MPMENSIFELQYALDTFYFLVCGALVMWMAAGFAMLEAGLVRSKNTTEILLKNVSLYAVACTMYMICGYSIMYGGGESPFLERHRRRWCRRGRRTRDLCTVC